MALSLGIHRGSRIRIGASELVVLQVPDPQTIVLSVDRGPHITLTAERRVLLMPEVYASCGMRDGQICTDEEGNELPERSRIAFEAPRRIKIERVRYDREPITT